MRRASRIFLALMISGGIPLFGAGGGEEGGFNPRREIQRAEELIETGRLDAALTLLSDVVRRNPEQIQRAQKLILRVRDIKERINTLFVELSAAIEAGDEVLADEKIRAVKKLDTDPNRNTLNQLIMGAVAVGKARNDVIRDAIFAEAETSMESGDYRPAADVYRSGFNKQQYLEFYDEYVSLAQDREPINRYLDDPVRQEKVWEAYGGLAPEGNRIIEELLASLEDWDASAAAMEREASSASSSLDSAEPAEWPGMLSEFTGSLTAAAEKSRSSRRIVDALENLRVSFYSVLDGIPEDFYFERIDEFMAGRSGRRNLEGIQAAQRRHWEAGYLDISGKMDERMRRYIDKGRTEIFARENAESVRSFTAALESAGAADSFASVLDDYPAGAEGGPESEAEGGDFLTRIRGSAALRAYTEEAVPYWLELNSLIAALPSSEGVGIDALLTENITAIADPLVESAGQVDLLRDGWKERDSLLARIPGSDSADVRAAAAALSDDLEKARGFFTDFRLFLYVDALSPLYDELASGVRADFNDDIDEARRLIFSDDSESLPFRRPSRSIDVLLNPALDELRRAESDITGFIDTVGRLLAREPPLENPDAVTAFRRRAESLLSDVRDTSIRLDQLRGDALVFANRARKAEVSALNELEAAGRELSTAREAVESGRRSGSIDEYYRAVSLLNSAAEDLDNVDSFYLEIFINDRDTAENSGIDESRGALRDQVQNDRGRLAVTVKQNAVNTARRSYDEGTYSLGIGVLSQSQEFWNDSYGENDPELAAWTTRLQNARQALGKTVIEPADPLYAEMNQYLNLAGRRYLEGVLIAERNPRNADALQAFREAEELLDQVLGVFPGNEAALLLGQKILRQTDGEAWSAEARKLVNDTRSALSRGDTFELQGTDVNKGLYVQISVLREIDPAFPGLDQLIYDTEAALGIIIPQPDPAVLSESRRITAEAEQVWTNLGSVGSQRALLLVERALSLWLDNTDASNLKNRILLSTEPERLPALPAQLLNLISLVEQYYDEGNFILAGAFLDRIADEYARFSGDPRIREWNRKVAARL